ncbi:hypothetical protein AAC387_Pa05g3622 [Persea americana]
MQKKRTDIKDGIFALFYLHLKHAAQRDKYPQTQLRKVGNSRRSWIRCRSQTSWGLGAWKWKWSRCRCCHRGHVLLLLVFQMCFETKVVRDLEMSLKIISLIFPRLGGFGFLVGFLGGLGGW